MRTLLLLPLLLTLSVTPAVEAAEAPSALPIYHARVVDSEGRTIAEYVLADDNGSEPPEVLGILETAEGYRAYVSYAFDVDRGIVTQRFTDLHSGWWVELQHDYGMRNLGRASDYVDPMEWTLVLNDRLAREKAPSTYTLLTSDGAGAEWVEPWGEPEEGRDARLTALAAFATSLVDSPMPGSAKVQLRLLLQMLDSEAGARLSNASHLLETVERVLAVAKPGDEQSASPSELRVDVSLAGHHRERAAQLLGLLPEERRTEADQPSKATPTRQQPQ